MKVVDDVKNVYTKLTEEKKGGKKLDIAESALGKYCGKKLSSKDNKLVSACRWWTYFVAVARAED